MKYDVVIGLEIHAQLNTESKIFSLSPTRFGADVNTQANEVDLAMPGVLPVLNEQAVIKAIKFGIATDCKINNRSIFERKNYFYPDLPKAYQISQFEYPIVGAGILEITNEKNELKNIGITRAHLEEDAGKSLHENFTKHSGIDLNRAGTPLLEIVSDPDLSSAKEAVIYAKKIHALVVYIEICDGNMQEGSFRCDANVSLKPRGTKELGIRSEIKNINSFKFLEKAINYEINRQENILDDGGRVVQETRLYDADKNETRSMRSKEESNDYRYFPDPDLLPVIIDNKLIQNIKDKMPESPYNRLKRFIDDLDLKEEDANLLCSDIKIADYFENIIKIGNLKPKLVANWIIVELMGIINKNNKKWQDNKINEQDFATLLQRITDNTISGKIAKQVFAVMWDKGDKPDNIIKKEGLQQLDNDDEIKSIITDIINKNPAQVQQYKDGKHKIIGFFVGQIMQQTKGKANPAKVQEILKQQLS
ncbi:MAG: Asp-tRNA(Asn)/Glu-tRNA(Gln) amidotransferase GatCAB subunit B [Gammaproteobacteria bacterium]|nr:MAG: Asp-tRNA(Asn)/Glu-tRNA(Gln) amidotransferase GatCAB subunit B [Gammaproteobacteria bacterium]